MTNNIFYTSLRYVIVELIGDVLYWPLWWYSKGLVKTGLFCLTEIKAKQERLGLLIWVKNLFTPMFGQQDFEGRVISFFARLIQIIFRSIILLLYVVLLLLFFSAWIALPVIISFQLIDNLLWLFT
ncbi:MAG: hypothetical protein CMI53_04860 [Parcubacteria group bacterium]|jgi:hypothetical protein|nr:hypothetical protein [Parcubacteria group bacterium]|tara:strand:- start:18449 stop:18826 length:378 start_codon:yes stop_codon:yes gene_type:complete